MQAVNNASEKVIIHYLNNLKVKKYL